MKLSEISNTVKGTYYAARMDAKSKNAIMNFAEKILKVPNILEKKKLHTTIIFSRKYAAEAVSSNEIYPITSNGKTLAIFPTQDDKRALVMKLDCPELIKRHEELMQEYEFTYDYDEYVPHVTLSYDCGDFEIEDFDGELPQVTFISEYVEDLELLWQNKD